MKKFEPMICPVCGKYYFSELQKGFERLELKQFLEGKEFCHSCGWIYDLNQAKNHDLKNGYNSLSVNEYKQEYQRILKENPKYNYLDANMPNPIPHMCPVCGEYEFPNEDSFDICPVCGWEDDGFYEGGGANKLSLNEAKLDFELKRKENPSYKWCRKFK